MNATLSFEVSMSIRNGGLLAASCELGTLVKGNRDHYALFCQTQCR
jgi:hypothetical protein